jgi:hypothetical protein
MALCAAMRPSMASPVSSCSSCSGGLALSAFVALCALVPGSASADDRASASSRFALDVGGVRHGFVRASVDIERTATGQQHLVLTAPELAPPLVTVLDAFTQSKVVKKDVRLTSGAVVRKANDARLVSARFPSLGGGGSTDVELGFDAAAITTQPLLSAKEAPPSPSSARITGFRVALTGLSAIDAPKLDSITVTQRSDGAATTGEIGFDVAAGGAAPFVAWQKASSGRSAPRSMSVEYIGGDGVVILRFQLDRCAPTSVRPMGASGTTRITLACVGLRST